MSFQYDVPQARQLVEERIYTCSENTSGIVSLNFSLPNTLVTLNIQHTNADPYDIIGGNYCDIAEVQWMSSRLQHESNHLHMPV